MPDLRGVRVDARPLGPKISSFSCSFWKKIAQIIGWRPLLELAPPPLGNPGSATEGGRKGFDTVAISDGDLMFESVVVCLANVWLL